VRYHLLAGVRTLHTHSRTQERIESRENKAEAACSSLNHLLWSDSRYLSSLATCAEVLKELASDQPISRDFGRTRDFTDQYLRRLLAKK
jgi:hypothetical protein